jgi:hypothetical protein
MCFALYLVYMIRRAMEAAKTAAPVAKTAPANSPAKAAPAQS